MSSKENLSKAEVAERVRELRKFADKVSTLSDEDLEKMVGGTGDGPIDWWASWNSGNHPSGGW